MTFEARQAAIQERCNRSVLENKVKSPPACCFSSASISNIVSKPSVFSPHADHERWVWPWQPTVNRSGNRCRARFNISGNDSVSRRSLMTKRVSAPSWPSIQSSILSHPLRKASERRSDGPS